MKQGIPSLRTATAMIVVLVHAALELNAESRPTPTDSQPARPDHPRPHSRRDDAAACDTDRCCSPGYFCAALTLACAPCALCAYDGDSAGFSCRARCGPAAPPARAADLRPPELLWLSLSPGAVDASAAPQPVEILFGVQVSAPPRACEQQAVLVCAALCCVLLRVRACVYGVVCARVCALPFSSPPAGRPASRDAERPGAPAGRRLGPALGPGAQGPARPGPIASDPTRPGPPGPVSPEQAGPGLC